MKKQKYQEDGGFFSGLSHNVRQPLNGVVEHLDLLLRRDMGGVKQNLLNQVQQGSHDLLMLINDILDWTRLQEGNFYLARETFDLQSVLESVALQLSTSLANQGISFDFRIHPDTPAQVSGDPGRLRQILVNLVLSWPRLVWTRQTFFDVTVEAESETDIVVRFGVHATGDTSIAEQLNTIIEAIGDPQKLENLIVVDHTTTTLRLALAGYLAVLMGGEIGLASDEDGALTLWLLTRFTKQIALGEKQIGQPQAIRELRICAVVDDRLSAEMSGWLESWGCRVRVCRDKAEAMPLLKRHAEDNDPFHLALLVGRTDGQEMENLGRAIKEDPTIHQTEILLVTQTGRRGDAARLREIGFGGYLIAPVKQIQMYQALSVIAERVTESATDSWSLITRHYLRERERGGLRIVIAENNAVHQMLTRLLLDKQGYQVTALTSEQYEQPPRFDLLLAGLEEGKKIVEHLPEQKMPATVVVMVAADEMSKREELLAAGFTEVVAKPITPPILRHVIAGHLARREKALLEKGAWSEASEPAIHLPTLLAQFDDDIEAVRDITRFFLEDFTHQLTSLTEAFAEGDAAKAKELACEMKDAAGTLELDSLRILLTNIQNLSASGQLAEAKPILARVDRLFARIKKTLAEL